MNNDLLVSLNPYPPLQGKSLALGIGGGIGAVESVKICRELRRLGAEVTIYATPEALSFIGETSLHWASTRPPIHTFSGSAHHLLQEDALIIVPTTANLLGQIAHGLCSNVVSTLAHSALGQNKPLILLPSMHESLFESFPIFQNFKTLEKYCLKPRKEEGKLKVPTPKDLALEISHKLYSSNQKPIHILMTLGGTQVPLDPLRYLTNFSTGRLGSIIAEYFYARGISITACYGLTQNVTLPQLENIQWIYTPLYGEMEKYLSEIKDKFQGFFHLAAVSDFQLKEPSLKKWDSQSNPLKVELTPTQKLIEMENLPSIPFRAACKLTMTEKEESQAQEFFKHHKLQALLWNAWTGLGDIQHQGKIFQHDSSSVISVSNKWEIAHEFFQIFYRFLKSSQNL